MQSRRLPVKSSSGIVLGRGSSSSLALLLALCGFSFFLGRYTRQYAQVEGLSQQQPRGRWHLGGRSRKLHAAAPVEAGLTADFAAVAAGTVPPLYHDPNDGTVPGPAQFEELLRRSGLVEARPPVQPGQSGNPNYTVAPFQVLSWYPRIILFPNLVDKARCELIMALASKRMAPSALALRKGETAEATKGIRTSAGAFIDSRSDPTGTLKWVEERIAQVTMLPVAHGEAFNVLRYDHQQHYDSHYDSFSPKEYGTQPSQRIATMLTYLSDVEEGGETVFLLEGKDTPVGGIRIDYKACDKGLKVRPRQGDAVLFWSAMPSGELDRRSLHGGCPVKKGQKWCMTKWIRDK